jgi:hypothetical protein
MKAFLMAGNRSGEELIVGLQDIHQDRSNYFQSVFMTKEHPPTSARPIKKFIKLFEDLSTNQNTGIKRQPQGKLESPAKYVRTMGSYGKGLFNNYVRDIQQINIHKSSEGEGVMEYLCAQDHMEGEANDGGLLGLSLLQSSEPAL